ncbi:hypothetical protein Pla123a_47950 [Posidoniimonas polymericola]|uniref:Uncharacterized protein n=1 Tax=Posidoniimonas polymericola TaxID=2528002 RepID=A0A5C5XSJ0_9BACT|nr:choice-of-anchor Q domain-containing protein [Posidoniimonas polymericola]TWT65884.1 hypothetical protein Pla123a_47950 [Posidoniimonas polymericola]
MSLKQRTNLRTQPPALPRYASRKPAGAGERRLGFEPLEDRRMLAVFAVSNLDDSGSGSLREAVALANSAAGADEIVFSGAAASGTIALTSGELQVTDALTMTGPGERELTIEGAGFSRVINFAAPDGSESSADLAISGLTLTGGVTVASNAVVDGLPETLHSGGGIRFLSSGQLTVTRSTIDSNHTLGDNAEGGGIFTVSGAVVLDDARISNNSTSGDGSSGGGVFTRHGAIQVVDSVLFENRTLGTEAFGGAIAIFDAVVEITDSFLQHNRAEDSDGGAIGMMGGDLTLMRGFVTDNYARHVGGGLLTSGVNAAIHFSVIAGNNTSGTGLGGGISATSGSFLLADSMVDDNFARNVGGLHLDSVQNPIIERTTISNNTSAGGVWGAGIRYVSPSPSDSSELFVVDTDIRGNVTQRPGGRGVGAGINATGPIRLLRTTVSDNHVLDPDGIAQGGAIAGFDVVLIDSTVSGNSTAATYANGGGIGGSNVTLINSTVSGNTMTGQQSEGGGIFASSLLLLNSTVSGNSAGGDSSTGGGIRAGSIRVISSTVTGNRSGGAGGGIHTSGSATGSELLIENSIVAGNLRNTATTAQPNDLTPGSGNRLSVRHSLIGVNTSVNLTGGAPNADGNYVGTLAEVGLIDPLLGPLADNGGPTQTHALLPGSPAIDTGAVQTAAPLYDYRLDTFADSLGAGDDLTNLGGAGEFSNGAYNMLLNQGLQTEIPAVNADNYTLELFIKFDDLHAFLFAEDYQKIIDFGADAHPLAGLYVYSSSGSVPRLRYVANPNGGFFTGGTQLAEDTWHHLVLTRDDTATNPLSLYIDGQFERDFPRLADATHMVGVFTEEGDSSATRLLTMLHSDSEPLFGLPRGGAVDRIRFFDRPLDADEIEDLYVAGPSNFVTEFDQRGPGFARVVGGRADMGAYELQVSLANPGDFNNDGKVDAADYTVWRDNKGSADETVIAGHGDNQNGVDIGDYTLWKENFGNQYAASVATSSLAIGESRPDGCSLRESLSAPATEPSHPGIETGRTSSNAATATATDEGLGNPVGPNKSASPTFSLSHATHGGEQSWTTDNPTDDGHAQASLLLLLDRQHRERSSNLDALDEVFTASVDEDRADESSGLEVMAWSEF